MEQLKAVSLSGENVMPALIEAVKSEVTLGEICNLWRELWGKYRAKDF